MSLQIRRGTEGQRTAITFDLGELVYTTDSKKLYIGDGGTVGGINVLASAAGTGLTWNPSTGTLNFNGDLSGYTTDSLAEGTVHQYYTNSRAQDAAAAIFTAVGSPTVTGTVTTTTAPHAITVSSNSGLVALEPFVVTGTGGNGLSAGTYYVVNPAAGVNQITVASSLANAQAGTAITVTTGGLSTTSFSAGGGDDSNITFTYNSTAKTMTATVSSLAAGIHSVNEDTNPLLGGNLGLNNHNITGTGNIGITGTISATVGLGANLPLNSFNINGSGNISITGSIGASGTLTATTGLGADLPLNSHGITGSGNINLSGLLTVSQPVNGANAATFYTTVFPNDSWVGMNTSRGSILSPSAVQGGDSLSGLVINAHDGTGYAHTVLFGALADTNGTISTGKVPGKFLVATQSGTTGAVAGDQYFLEFNSLGMLTIPTLMAGDGTAVNPSIGFTTDGSKDSGFFHPGDGIICTSINGVETVRVDSGGMRVSGFMKVAQVNGTLPSPPEAGMIVLDGTTFKGYNGSAWVNLN